MLLRMALFFLNYPVRISQKSCRATDGYVSQINEMESYVDKFKSFHWDAVEINGHDYNAIHEAILNAKAVQDKPSAIILHTIKGKGCTFAERTWCHHISVSKEDMEEALQALQA